CMSCVFLYESGANRDLPSFPTRRSSDLRLVGVRRPVDHVIATLRCALPGIVLAAGPPGGAVEERLRRNAADVRTAATEPQPIGEDRKSTRLNSSHVAISYAVFCLKKKTS